MGIDHPRYIYQENIYMLIIHFLCNRCLHNKGSVNLMSKCVIFVVYEKYALDLYRVIIRLYPNL
jgi:hypothetical protein